jgi:hypothetical protein
LSEHHSLQSASWEGSLPDGTEDSTPTLDNVFGLCREEYAMGPTYTFRSTEAETGRLVMRVVGTARLRRRSFCVGRGNPRRVLILSVLFA